MKLLLDTHILIWAATNAQRISAPTRSLIENPANQPAFSVASLWEMMIKAGDPRNQMPVDAQRLRTGLLANGYAELDIKASHTMALRDLPWLHRDPFDRLLIAQAIAEGMSLLTSDKRMIKYGDPVIRA